jgi:hypothetical protein
MTTAEQKFLLAAITLTEEAHSLVEAGKPLDDNHIIATAVTNKDRYEIVVRLKK